ncbi:BH1724 [Halalkalibacterium halodurans C-125]|uniref:BH1724 protein n=1 Tax=Halalkalibacterium halodurans (strain ATCC BAA-125 / DSM 18197 / FERM 7344 / JCM 9153 / C-125) TaxID=272558 RepID=Q9KC50_HALH5|nr:BH1724 [Halalkalibacterium halodurans C-125]
MVHITQGKEPDVFHVV